MERVALATLRVRPVRDDVSSGARPPIRPARKRSGDSPRAVVALLAGALSVVLGISMPMAAAAPGDGRAAAQSEHDAAAAEVERIQGLVTQSEQDLARITVEAEATADASRQAAAELAAAEAQAVQAQVELQNATATVDQARAGIAELGRESYIGSDSLGTAASFLDARGPADVLQRAATLDLLSDDRAERLAGFKFVQEQQARAREAAQAAVTARSQAAGAAAEAEAAANARLTEARAAHDAVVAEKATLNQQLQEAEIELLRVQGAADPRATWEQGVNAEYAQADATAAANALAAASGQAVPPTTGRVTSCYGSRWGTMHYGVDIAASIGTPVYAPEGGRVLQAGPASGFGLAVYIQHADGSITVYGHINDYFVKAGQQVAAGQQIAEVGNKGQSTGPHLHFEVHNGGLYQNRTNPVPWLAARGVPLGGGC
jgi:murein DD-endopeptidase MepM/ murein hydrolase activator NlpD